MIRITKIFRFEAAHALPGYDGPCKNIHGHSYELHVTVKGVPINDDSNPHNGMVIEFSDIKTLVNTLIINKLDHALILPEGAKSNIKDALVLEGQKMVLSPYQPTCENLLYDFAKILSERLPEYVKLQHLKLFETASSYAEWDADDQTRA